MNEEKEVNEIIKYLEEHKEVNEMFRLLLALTEEKQQKVMEIMKKIFFLAED